MLFTGASIDIEQPDTRVGDDIGSSDPGTVVGPQTGNSEDVFHDTRQEQTPDEERDTHNIKHIDSILHRGDVDSDSPASR